MKRIPVLVLALVLAIAACSEVREGQDLPGADTLTQAQRDSIIGASKLPGARTIQRARDISDSASARAERLDTIGS
jgi:hypothetical protein